MTKSLTLMLTVISESNFPYFDGSIFHNFTIVCFALLRLRAGAGVMKQRKLQQLCEEILLGCCLAQVMAAADISPSYISPVPGNTCTIVLRPHPAIITPHGGCYMRISPAAWLEFSKSLVIWVWVWSDCVMGVRLMRQPLPCRPLSSSPCLSLQYSHPRPLQITPSSGERDQRRGGNKKTVSGYWSLLSAEAAANKRLLQPILGQWEAVIETNDSPEANWLTALKHGDPPWAEARITQIS